MYNNEVRVANTATPSFTTQTNVGQYGWTESDQGRFNQLIQYVDLCKQYSDRMSETTTYVERIAKYISEVEPHLQGVENSIDTVKTYQRIVESDKNTVNGVKKELLVLKGDFDTKYQGFISASSKWVFEIGFESQWYDIEGEYLPVKAIKVGTFVKLQGVVGHRAGATKVIGTLPAEVRPSRTGIFLCPAVSSLSLEINSSGVISIKEQDHPDWATKTWISLDNISFYIE